MIKRALAAIATSIILILPVGYVDERRLYWFGPVDAVVPDRVEAGWAIVSALLYMSALIMLRADNINNWVGSGGNHARNVLTVSIAMNAAVLIVIPTIVHAAKVVPLNSNTEHAVTTSTSVSFYMLAIGNVCIALYIAQDRLAMCKHSSRRRYGFDKINQN
jgi:hypothetical protein